MKTLVEKSAIAVTLSVVLTGLGSTAFAEGPSKKISYADLNLEQSEDVAVLYERIHVAADKVCRESSGPRDGYHRRNYNRCYQGAVELAVKEVNHFALTTLHEGNSGSIAIR